MSTVKSKSLKSVNQMEKGIAMDKFKVKSVKSVNSGAKEAAKESAKTELGSLAEQFVEFGKVIASSSGNATKQMLAQGRIACEVEEKFATSGMSAYYIHFREQTETVCASKWSQYKRIGRVADVLEPFVDRLPSGWSVLSSIAVLFDAKTKEGNRKYSTFSVEDLLNVKISFTGRKKETRTKSLTPTSTQSEVRAVVDKLLGKEKREKTVTVASAYRPTLTIDWSSVKGKTFDTELTALGKSIASLSKQYPWFSFDPASFGRNGLNAVAKRVVVTTVGKGVQLSKVA